MDIDQRRRCLAADAQLRTGVLSDMIYASRQDNASDLMLFPSRRN